MSQRELELLRMLEQMVAGVLSQYEVATLLDVSVRQVRRLQRRYEAQGAQGLLGHQQPCL